MGVYPRCTRTRVTLVTATGVGPRNGAPRGLARAQKYLWWLRGRRRCLRKSRRYIRDWWGVVTLWCTFGMAAPKKTKNQLQGARALTPAQLAEVREIEEDVMALRIKGVSFRQIERDLGITHADRVFKRAMARTGENTAYVRAEAQRVEAERIDALQAGVWEQAVGGSPRHVEMALRILERRAKLFGLDFQDMVNAKAIELEEAKVRMMAVALSAALDSVKLTVAQKRTIQATFLGELQIAESSNVVD